MYTSGGITILDQFIPQKHRDLQQKQNWQAYQARIDKRLRMFNDYWADQLIGYICTQIGEETRKTFFPNVGFSGAGEVRYDEHLPPRWPLPTYMNVLKRVIDSISLVYNGQATRTFSKTIEASTTATPQATSLPANGLQPLQPNGLQPIQPPPAPEKKVEESERYGEIVGGNFNAIMQRVNQLTNLNNVTLVRPVVDENYESGFRFDILTPDMFTPIQSMDDPSRLIGVAYCVDLTDTGGSYGPTRREYLIYMGEDDEEPFIAISDNYSKEKVEKLPYPFIYENEKYLPFAVFRKDQPQLGEFINRYAGEDLHRGTLQVAYLLSRWERAFAESSSKQMMFTGPKVKEEVPQNMILDHLHVVKIPGTKEETLFQMIDHQVDIKGQWEALENFIASITEAYGISKESFKAVAQSGLSIKLQNEGLITIIEGQKPHYRAAEKDLAEIIRKLNNSERWTKKREAIPNDYEFGINFGPLPFEDEPLDKLEIYQVLVQENLMSKPQLLMILDPDIKTEEEAMGQILRNAQTNRLASRVAAGFTAAERPLNNLQPSFTANGSPAGPPPAPPGPVTGLTSQG